MRARAVLDAPEKVYMQQILEVAMLFGWRHYHTHDSRRSPAGLPDLLLCKPPRLVAVEVKGARGRLSPEQRWWLDALAACGIEVHVWRSGVDTLQDIAAVLQRG